MSSRLGKVLVAFGLGLALSGCLTTQQPGPDPSIAAANEATRQKAKQDREISTNRLLARYAACVRAAFADQYDKNVEKGAAADLAFAACQADEQALHTWFTENPVASAPIRTSMSDRKLRLREELIAQYP
jgi:hypothetical protein